jgi:hypothetical protein
VQVKAIVLFITTHVPSGTVTWSSDTPADANVIANGTTTALAAAFAVGTPNIKASETIHHW